MGNHVYLADNAGQRVVPGAVSSTPDISTNSQQLTNAAANTNTTATVAAGRSYLLVPVATGGFYAGWATVATAANVKYVAALGSPGVVIHVPIGKTTLNYATTANNGIAYLIPLDKAN